MTSKHFKHLEERCHCLIARFLEPFIESEKTALALGQELPTPNLDDFAAFKLLTHAELEVYFEKMTLDALNHLDSDFKSGHVLTSKFAKLIYLYSWKEKKYLNWPGLLNPQAVTAFQKSLAQEALGFGRQFVKNNNGIKEDAMQIMSAIMGFFPQELDSILIEELNKFGTTRGEVAHQSVRSSSIIFESAEIEKTKLLNILKLANNYYEKAA